eukprot:scaffold7689_cov114-Isochrysis_galbana.AAC.3
MAHPLTRVVSHHLTPAHWHTLILTTPSSSPQHQHPDCFRCLAACSPAARVREARRPQLPAQCAAAACLPACTPRQPDGCIASKDVTEACFTHSLTLQTKKTSALRRRQTNLQPCCGQNVAPLGISASPNTSNLSLNPSYPPEETTPFPFQGAA